MARDNVVRKDKVRLGVRSRAVPRIPRKHVIFGRVRNHVLLAICTVSTAQMQIFDQVLTALHRVWSQR